MPLANLTGFHKVIIIMSHFPMPLADLTGFRTVIIIMFHFVKNAANFTENMISTVSKSMLPTSTGTLSVLLFKACCQLTGINTISHTPHGMLLTSQWSLFLLPTARCWLHSDHYSCSPQHVADFTVITIPAPHSMLLTSQWSLFLLPTACCWLHSDHYSCSPQHVADFTVITIPTPHSMLLTSQWSLFLLPTACCWLHSDHYSYSPQHVADFTVITIPTPHITLLTSNWPLFLLPKACCQLHSDHYSYPPPPPPPPMLLTWTLQVVPLKACSKLHISEQSYNKIAQLPRTCCQLHRDPGQQFNAQRSWAVI